MIRTFYETRLLNWYTNLDRPFDKPLPISPGIVSFVLQMFLETFTDIFCCANGGAPGCLATSVHYKICPPICCHQRHKNSVSLRLTPGLHVSGMI